MRSILGENYGISFKSFDKKNDILKFGGRAGKVIELKWKNDETVMLDGFVRARIKFPINKKNCW